MALHGVIDMRAARVGTAGFSYTMNLMAPVMDPNWRSERIQQVFYECAAELELQSRSGGGGGGEMLVSLESGEL
eukprot:SAG22_NODE_1921_length_3308_cov_1.802431_4_plen_74_part_00